MKKVFSQIRVDQRPTLTFVLYLFRCHHSTILWKMQGLFRKSFSQALIHCLLLCAIEIGDLLDSGRADIRNPLHSLLMNAVASRSVSGSFQLPLTEASPLTRRLVLCALEAGECLSAFKKSPGGITPAGGYANSRPHTCLNTNNYGFIKPFRHCQVH